MKDLRDSKDLTIHDVKSTGDRQLQDCKGCGMQGEVFTVSVVGARVQGALARPTISLGAVPRQSARYIHV